MERLGVKKDSHGRKPGKSSLYKELVVQLVFEELSWFDTATPTMTNVPVSPGLWGPHTFERAEEKSHDVACSRAHPPTPALVRKICY